MRKSILALSLLALLSSCDKNDDDDNKEITPTVANLSGSYKVTAASANISGQTFNLLTNEMYFDNCQKDDLYVLNSNLSYEVKDQGTQCSPSSNDTGTWSLNGNKLAIDGDEATIKSWNGKAFVVEFSDGSGTLSFTYTKQ